ncbi:Uu.00g104960.m01.CDS01 [Anthostomella pinea]|uniref:alpha-1,2-Mannosidase n=1 Tax=Anthostomella pinea TaxID=933095 RepID=A0AAI8YFR2_9PEZI|nr:Uu.00g104960.m01.CDS01 [Anthostomella pinea]
MAVMRGARTRLIPITIAILLLYLMFVILPGLKDVPKSRDFTYVKSSFDWSTVPETYPIPASELTALPKGKSRTLPKVQFAFRPDTTRAGRAHDLDIQDRQKQIKHAFEKSWTSYKNHAWMFDELTPVSGEGKNTFGGWAATLVDSLDTLWIMDMKADFYDAVAAVATIDWSDTQETACNFFETTIRHLGGLLSAYDLSQEAVLLQKAVELGDMLYMAFDTPNRMPPFWLDFNKARTGTLHPGTHDPSATVASSPLEFTRLAQLTGEDKYYDAIDRITRLLDQTQNSTKLPGMWPTFFDMENLVFDQEEGFTLGALADSLYELLPKMYAILGGLEPVYEKLYRDAMDAVTEHLLFRPMTPDQADILFTGNVYVRKRAELQPEVQHLGCFVGGMFGLGGKLLGLPEQLEIGEKITKGCVWAYDAMPAGIMPEIMAVIPCPTLAACEWDQAEWEAKGDRSLQKGIENARDPRYILRPEAIESVFLMYRITGKQEYQDMAWRMFQSIRKATETSLAFSAISDVTVNGGAAQKDDSMESFWLSETLKYFYLIFSPPGLISLDEYVLNTEAHPLKRP